MTKAVDWLVDQKGVPAIVAGDFNWGYRKEGEAEPHKREGHVTSLHERGKVFQAFADISYLEAGGADNFRTNLGFRKEGRMYDQFLLSASLTNRLADGGRLLVDIGIVAFDVRNRRMKKVVTKEERGMEKALDMFLSKSKLDRTRYESSVEEARARFRTLARERATYRISDHRPIWIQLKVF